jgi:hypothetical protein
MLTLKPWRRQRPETVLVSRESSWSRTLQTWRRRGREEASHLFERFARKWPALRGWMTQLNRWRSKAEMMP